MTTTRTVKQTVNALVQVYKKEIQEAAGNNVLTTREESKISPWARRHIHELRGDVDTVTVGKAVAHLKPIITRAAEAIAGSDGKIDAQDVRKLRVTELRTRAASLFDAPGGAGNTKADLQKALRAANVDAITDYGKGFDLTTHRPDATMKGILAEMRELSESELGDTFDLTTGANAVKEFVDTIKDAGKDFAENAETAAEAMALRKAYNDVANSAAAYFKGDDYKKFVFARHGIEEDGDIEHNVLLAQKQDGSWQSLTYTDFPF